MVPTLVAMTSQFTFPPSQDSAARTWVGVMVLAQLCFFLGVLRATPLPLSPADRPFLPARGRGGTAPFLTPQVQTDG